MNISADTITAIATPPGRGGVGIIRISGKACCQIAKEMLGKLPDPRQATLTPFLDEQNKVIDEGIALFFPSPHSYTGEDVLELQGHGGPVVMDLLLQRILELGARLANPGEFTERAFLNDKMDLSQAEAVADLIDASSQQAARSAVRSLQGEFSNQINVLTEELIQLRMMIEAAIDFPEEEIDFLAEMQASEKVNNLIKKIKKLLSKAEQGAILQQGITVVIAGKPNAGKSSLLNCLSQRDSAIVTDIAGTTRDPLREHIHIDGMPLHVIDTAGLREDSRDIVEAEGIRRSWQAIEQADLILLVVDASQEKFAHDLKLLENLPEKLPVVVIQNKIDLIDQATPRQTTLNGHDSILLSAKNTVGVDYLRSYLKNFMGFTTTADNTFIARRRHLGAIEKAQHSLEKGLQQLKQRSAGELLAEDLRQAQLALAEITGEITADDLLGRIFSSFCIGK